MSNLTVIIWNRWNYYQIQPLAAIGGTSGFVPPTINYLFNYSTNSHWLGIV